MRIKSNFKDYYDGCQPYGDNSILFIRNKTLDTNEFGTIEKDAYLEFYSDEEPYFPKLTSITLVGVGNTIYPILMKCETTYIHATATAKTSNKIYAGSDCIKEYALHNKANSWWDRKQLIDDIDYITNYINSNNAIELTNRFGPVFVLHNKSCEIYNKADQKQRLIIEKTPKLSSYGIHKLLPTMEAYIAIERFLQNKANPAKPIPEMDNNTKIELAGFDKKTSFRKTKQ